MATSLVVMAATVWVSALLHNLEAEAGLLRRARLARALRRRAEAQRFGGGSLGGGDER